MVELPTTDQAYAPPKSALVVERGRAFGFWLRFGLTCAVCSLVYPMAAIFLVPPDGLPTAIWTLLLLCAWFLPVVWILLPELRKGFIAVSSGRMMFVSLGFLVTTVVLTVVFFGVLGVLFSLFEAYRYGT